MVHGLKIYEKLIMKVECTVLLKTALTAVMWIWWLLGKKLHNCNIVLNFFCGHISSAFVFFHSLMSTMIPKHVK